MTRYIPHTEQEVKEMLREIGVSRVEDLFTSIEKVYRRTSPPDLPLPQSEIEVLSHFAKLFPNDGQEMISFLGAGCYDHFVPLVVDVLASRGEFLTSYTPYQPEMAQGTLQAIYEFQTMVALLTGMEVANASMYDGATSLMEAILMAKRVKPNRSVVWLPETVHPDYRAVLSTYVQNQDIEVRLIPFDVVTGETDWTRVDGDNSLCLVVQSPNFFGVLEDMNRASQIAKKLGALLVVSIMDPTVLGLLKPPGAFGADIVTGEAQSFGNSPFFGGPHVGFFATKKEFVRQMPGRLCGETVDSKGRRAFTLTLSTREQHIRREKANSNICTNQGVLALRATMALALLGEQGVREMASQSHCKAEYTKKRCLEIPGVKSSFTGATYHEFVLSLPKAAETVLEKLLEHGIVGGLSLSHFYKNLNNTLLVTVTEKRTRYEMDKFVDTLCRIIAA